MYKKIILIICLIILTGCNMYYVNNRSIEETIDTTIASNNELFNVNNKGYRYYLPMGFNVEKDDGYNQVLGSLENNYFMYIDVVSYYYKTPLKSERELNDYLYYTFKNNNVDGYLKITEKNNNFFVELCYNYAIIEVVVEEKDIEYAVSNSINILNSVKYNDLIVEKYIGENDIESSETIYEIPSPENKSNQNILEYIDQYDYTEENN